LEARKGEDINAMIMRLYKKNAITGPINDPPHLFSNKECADGSCICKRDLGVINYFKYVKAFRQSLVKLEREGR